MKTLILGMGNPILSDDGVGLVLAERLRNKIHGADVAASAIIGLSLFDLIMGYDTLFIIDAMTTKEGQVGGLKKIGADDRCGTLHLFSSHGFNIFDLMELGLQCGFEMPCLAAVYGVEIGSEVAFDESLSQGLHEKIPAIAAELIDDMTAIQRSLSAAAATS